MSDDYEFALKLSKKLNNEDSGIEIVADEDILTEFSHEFEFGLGNETRSFESIPSSRSSLKKPVTSLYEDYNNDADYQLALKISQEINSEPSSSQNDDYLLALKVTEELEKNESKSSRELDDADFLLAMKLSQEDFEPQVTFQKAVSSEAKLVESKALKSKSNRNYDDETISVVDPSWETIDPNPDIYMLFAVFNKRFFWGKLDSVEVKWSPRMTLCAGVCSYSSRAGFCSVRLSKPLLQYRPRKDLVETLLHEMIHAFLFVTKNDRDRDGHGPRFHSHMHRINRESGANITVYHSFHDEVNVHRTHWWKCDGPCQFKPPFYGIVKKSMNRAPGPNHFWWNDHRAMCGGNFIKIKEPEGYVSKKSKNQEKGKVNNLNNYFGTKASGGEVGTSKVNKEVLDTAFIDLTSSAHVTASPVPNNNPNSRGKKILGLVDLNSKKKSENFISPNQNSKSPKKSSQWVPLPGQKNILQFVNKM